MFPGTSGIEMLVYNGYPYLRRFDIRNFSEKADVFLRVALSNSTRRSLSKTRIIRLKSGSIALLCTFASPTTRRHGLQEQRKCSSVIHYHALRSGWVLQLHMPQMLQLFGLFARLVRWCAKPDRHQQDATHVWNLRPERCQRHQDRVPQERKSPLFQKNDAGQHSLPEFACRLRKAKLLLLLRGSTKSGRSGHQTDVRDFMNA